MVETPLTAFRHLVADTITVMKDNPNLKKEDNKEYNKDVCVIRDVIKALEDFAINRLKPAWQREKNSLNSPYVLAFVGLTNVGKSTLIEELLGCPAPAMNGPATAIPVRYIHDSDWRIRILYRAAIKSPKEFSFSNSAELGNMLSKIVLLAFQNNASDVSWVDVFGPMGVLSHDLRLIDTPGFGAAHTGDEQSLTTQRLEDLINKQIDRVYFCVASGDEMTVSKEEKDFFYKVAPVCGHVLVTKWEGDEKNQKKYKEIYEPLFPGAQMAFVNARDGELRELRGIIEECSTPEKRLALCCEEVISAWDDIHEAVKSIDKSATIPWLKSRLDAFLYSCKRSGLNITRKP